MNILAAGGDPTSLINIVQTGGVVSLLLIIIFGGYKKMWVWGWIYKESIETILKVQHEADEWKELALRSSNLVQSLDERRKGGKG